MWWLKSERYVVISWERVGKNERSLIGAAWFLQGYKCSPNPTGQHLLDSGCRFVRVAALEFSCCFFCCCLRRDIGFLFGFGVLHFWTGKSGTASWGSLNLDGWCPEGARVWRQGPRRQHRTEELTPLGTGYLTLIWQWRSPGGTLLGKFVRIFCKFFLLIFVWLRVWQICVSEK